MGLKLGDSEKLERFQRILQKIAAYLSTWDRIHKRLFGIFNLVRTAEDLIPCPVPWAPTGETGFAARE